MRPGEKYIAECLEAIVGTPSYAGGHGKEADPEKVKKRIEIEIALARGGDPNRTELPGKVTPEEIERIYQERQKLVDKNEPSPLLTIFQEVTKEFLAVARKAGMTLPHDPVVGTLPIGVMNAWTTAVPLSDEFVIVFHSGLGLYLNRMLKITLALSAATDRAAYDAMGRDSGWQEKYSALVEAALSKDNTYEKHFVSVLISYLLTGDPNLAPPIYISESYHSLQGPILYYTEMYIAGHECAHLLLGHVKSDNRKIKRMLGAKEVVKYEWKWEEEYAADALGVMLTSLHSAEAFLAKVRPMHFMNIQGADFSMSCAEVLDELLNAVMGMPEQTQQTHPPLAERRKRIRVILNTVTGEPDANYYGEEWRIILQLLLKRNRHKIVSLFPSPDALSTVWRDGLNI